MIRLENNIISKAKIIMLEERSWIIIHLGINPRKGGRPPSDKRFMGMSIASNILFFLWFKTSDIVKELIL